MISGRMPRFLPLKLSTKTGIKFDSKTNPELQKKIDARIAAARERVAAQKEKDSEAVERLLQEQGDVVSCELDAEFTNQVEIVRMYLRMVSLGSSHNKVDLMSGLEKLKGILSSMKAVPNACLMKIETNEKTFIKLCDEVSLLFQ